ncbi:MAG: hypothetical protein ABUS49_09500 [Acidobacteriota bacterium]
MRGCAGIPALAVLAFFAPPPAVLAVELHPPAVPPLARVRRIYVDQLGGGAGSDQMRDMLIASMQHSGLFVLTENPERADATLKGSSDQKFFTDEHQTSDSIGIHASEGTGSSSGARLGTNSSARQNLSTGISQSEASHFKEHIQEVGASVRLVDAEGDVIWSTTQESNGAKFRGAMADVAEKIARHLAEETKNARAAAGIKPDGLVK